MCTLSLFRKPSGYSVFMNRDERHDRAPELPPQFIDSDHRIFGPVDPVSNGTWIAHNDNGFWGCLLNGYFEKDINKAAGYESRGRILPDILSQDDPLDTAQNIDPSPYPSFRLLIGSAHSHKLMTWDGRKYSETPFHDSYEDRVFFLSSSSWEQNEVIEKRKKIFEDWIRNNPSLGDEMPDFHCSQAPHPEAAIFMMRSYSGTKSITSMNICEANITMSYLQASDIKNAADYMEIKKA